METIRYYERSGIVPPPARAANGRRVYSRTDIGRLRFIRRCRDLGLSMASARTLLDLSEHPAADCGAVEELGRAHLAELRRRIADLSALSTALEELLDNCRAGSPTCPMLDRLKADDR